MKQSSARLLVLLSLIFSTVSFLFTLISFYLPQWKTIELASTFKLTFTQTERPYIDPLIRNEIEKYLENLYRRGEKHSFGLFRHCLNSDVCGKNHLLTFSPVNYGLCHHIDHHRQCIFSTEIIAQSTELCRCEIPSYIRLIKTLGICLVLSHLMFIVVDGLRLIRQQYRLEYLDDIHLRSIVLVAALFSSISSILILIQQRTHRAVEPLEFLESMRRTYSSEQIYSFSNDLELIIAQIRSALKIDFSFSYFLMFIVFLLSLVSLICSSMVEIKIPSTVELDEDQKENFYQNSQTTSIIKERSVPSEHFQNVRQTRV